MKHIIYAISVFLVLTVLASCTDKEAMRQRLAYVSECNRADTLFTEAWLPTVDSLVCFFDRHGDANERMAAHYLQGRVHHDMGDSPGALACYRNATNAADTTDRNCDFKTLSRIYGQMGSLFREQRSPDLGKAAYLNAMANALKDKDTLSSLFYYGRVSNIHHMQDQLDSALQVCLYVNKRLKQHGAFAAAASQIITAYDIYLKRGQLAEAKSCLDEYERHSGYVDGLGNVSEGLESYYYFKGKLYEETNRLDSAILLYRKLLPHCESNKDLYEYSYSGLLSAYAKLGKTDSVMKYAILFAAANDSSTIRHSSEEVVRMQSLYNYNEKQATATRKAIESERYRRLLYLTIVGVVLAMIIAYLTWRSREKRYEQELLSWNKKYYDTLTQYHHAKDDLFQSYNNTREYGIAKEREVEGLRQALSNFIEGNVSSEMWDREHSILSAPIVARMHQLAGRAKEPVESEWDEIRRFVREHFPSFYNSIYGESASLSVQERKAAILIRLRFIPTELVVLLNLSKQRITNIRSSINFKLFQVKGTKGLDANIGRL